MHSFGVRDVERLLRLPRSTIRMLIEAGFVSPARGPRNAWQFSFQDLIVLRTAQALAAAKVPHRRITRSMKELRRHLPQSMPLSGLSICAVADRVVVKEGGSRWQADSGQYLLAFDGDPANGSLSVIERGSDTKATAADCFAQGVALEAENAQAARQAYERAIAADPAFVDAHVNLGSLLHEAGEFAQAERVYREAIDACGDSDPVLLYNLGVLLDDLNREHEAMEAYERALRSDPDLADCHYNLALLCRKLGRPREAIRHMAEYRRLLGSKAE
ncbi:MAG: tetratricopeptide repeat protein [Burkholderiales bacterium]